MVLLFYLFTCFSQLFDRGSTTISRTSLPRVLFFVSHVHILVPSFAVLLGDGGDNVPASIDKRWWWKIHTNEHIHV